MIRVDSERIYPYVRDVRRGELLEELEPFL